MALTINDAIFAQLCINNDYDISEIIKEIKKQYSGYHARKDRVTNRILNLRKKGVLPLDSGNYVSRGELLKGTSTLYNGSGDVKLQWVKTDVEKESILDSFKTCIDKYVKGYR